MSNCNACHGLLRSWCDDGNLPEVYIGTRNDGSFGREVVILATDCFVPKVTVETYSNFESELAMTVTGGGCLGLKPYEDRKASGEQDRSNGIIGAVISSQRESRTNIQIDSRIS